MHWLWPAELAFQDWRQLLKAILARMLGKFNGDFGHEIKLKASFSEKLMPAGITELLLIMEAKYTISEVGRP